VWGVKVMEKVTFIALSSPKNIKALLDHISDLEAEKAEILIKYQKSQEKVKKLAAMLQGEEA
jgi:hypothetical protein